MFGAAAAALFLAGIIVCVAAVQMGPSTPHRRRRGWLSGYFTNDATQLAHPESSGRWVFSDHLARRRGHGLAAPFRRCVFHHLTAEADRHRAVIIMATHSEKLAQVYTSDMPELYVVTKRRTMNGPTWTLRRDPKIL